MSHLQANKQKEKEPGGAASERRTGEDTVPAGDKLMGGAGVTKQNSSRNRAGKFYLEACKTRTTEETVKRSQ